MTPYRLIDGEPWQGERPAVALLIDWPGSVSVRTRAEAQELADTGFGGVVSTEPTVLEAARRAGLLPCDTCDLPRVDGPAAAFAQLLGGQRLIYGSIESLEPVANWLLMLGSRAAWTPQPAIGNWLVAQSTAGLAAFGASGGEVAVAVSDGTAIHWFEPVEGRPLAISTPEPGPNVRVRVAPGRPMVVLIAPTRYRAAVIDALAD